MVFADIASTINTSKDAVWNNAYRFYDAGKGDITDLPTARRRM
jgi:hypothetical protein